MRRNTGLLARTDEAVPDSFDSGQTIMAINLSRIGTPSNIIRELNAAMQNRIPHGEMRSRDFPASKDRIERLMQENDIRAKHKRRFKVTTDSKVKCKIIEFSNKQEKTRKLNEYAGFKWCRREESNLRPTRYECVALPTELLRHKTGAIIRETRRYRQAYAAVSNGCCSPSISLTSNSALASDIVTP